MTKVSIPGEEEDDESSGGRKEDAEEDAALGKVIVIVKIAFTIIAFTKIVSMKREMDLRIQWPQLAKHGNDM